MLSSAEWDALFVSARVASCATLGCLVPGIFLAWLLARRNFFGKSIVEAFIYLPMVLPPVVPGYLLLVLFGTQGILGKYLNNFFGISIAFTWQGAALASAIIALPLMIQTIRLNIKLIDQRLEYVAATLGASPLRVFFTITLPLSLPGILAGALLCFCRALGEFGATITFVGNISGETQTIPLAIYSAIHQIDGEASAIRLILICIFLTFAALLLSNAISRRAEKWLGAQHD